VTSRSPTTSRRPVKWRVYLRGWLTVLLIVIWLFVATSGFLSWLGMDGFGKAHPRVAIVAVVLTLLHVVLEWKPLIGALRYVVNVHRARTVTSRENR